MQERNVLNGVVAVGLSGFCEFLYPLRWLLLLALVLILADLRFGIQAAKFRGDKIRLSRAGRRTINKAVDYLCWTMLAATLGKAVGDPLGIPLMPLLVLLVIFGFEINSCFNNYFESRGKNFKINIFDFFRKKTDIIEIEDKDNDNDNK